MHRPLLAAVTVAATLSGCGGADTDMRAFADAVADCTPAAFVPDGAAGAAGRYAVEGWEDGRCRVSFAYTRNPNPRLAGKQLSFSVDPGEPVAPQLRAGVTHCLEGRRGAYACRGDLYRAVGGTQL